MASTVHQAIINAVQGRPAGRQVLAVAARREGRNYLRRQLIAFSKWHAKQTAPRRDNSRLLVSRNKREGSL